MLKISIFLCCLLCMGQSLQAQNFEWVKQFSSGVLPYHWDYEQVIDEVGNVYLFGDFDDTVDFDPGPGVFTMSATGYKNTFISKLDPNGNFLWAKQFGYTYLNEVEIDAQGNLYLTGSYGDTIDFDPGSGVYDLISLNDLSMFVTKLDTQGDLIWAKSIGGTSSNDHGTEVTLDHLGNIYVFGRFTDTTDCDPGPANYNLISADGYDGHITKLDNNGNFVWAKQFVNYDGGLGFGSDLLVDSAQNVYVMGQFVDTVDIDFGTGVQYLISQGGREGYMIKLDVNGDLIWGHRIGGVGMDEIYDFVLDDDNNIYITGYFSEWVDFDPSSTSMDFLDCPNCSNGFLAKYDENGNFIWVKQVAGDYVSVSAITIDHQANLYMSGVYQDSADLYPNFGTDTLYSSNYGRFLARADTSGNINWVGGFDAAIGGVKVDTAGNVFVIAFFTDTFDVNPGFGTTLISPVTSEDRCVIKLGTCQESFSIFETSACDSIVWMDGNTYTESTTAPLYFQTNAMGCDSVVVLNLTILNTTSIDSQLICGDAYTWIDGITYTANTDAPTHTLVNSAGCDSVITLNLILDTVSAEVQAVGSVVYAIDTDSTVSLQWLDCDEGHWALFGETDTAFYNNTPDTGYYALEITSPLGCVDTSDCVEVLSTILNIEEVGDLGHIRIYPNPVQDVLTIDLGKHQVSALNLYDNSGRLVYHTTAVIQGEHQLALDLASGTYILVVTSTFGTQQFKLRVD